MLFNSFAFCLFFLPIALLLFFLIGSRFRVAASAFLGLASFVFYGWSNPSLVPLLLASIVFNFFASAFILKAEGKRRKLLLTLAISVDLAVLGYFKYLNFFATSAESLFGLPSHTWQILLPLGISFFTFTQIAFLVDTYQGKVQERNPFHYLLFVTYFPHLIAGPVLHHAEMMPQFSNPKTYRPRWESFSAGLLTFLLGMFKKVVLADGIQPFVGYVFEAPHAHHLTIFEAWGGALCYALQLYFDFSGYTDMAIGISRMFNVELPQNFDSPYKATSIIDFWRRWHMTLSRFLRDYLYIPLGGNRKGEARRYLNLFATMFLGGLWHGAGWTFVVWGTLHGGYLFVNHLWRDFVLKRPGREWLSHRGWVPFSWALTMVAVVVGWVYFRALSLHDGNRVVAAMFGSNSLVAPSGWKGKGLESLGFVFGPQFYASWRMLIWIVTLGFFALAFPNLQQVLLAKKTNEIFLRERQKAGRPLSSAIIGASLALIGLLLLVNASRSSSEFIYFNF